MGNFEKLSVLVIGVIIVMILVVAIYTWTGDPADPEGSVGETAPLSTPATNEVAADDGDGWLAWTEPDRAAPGSDSGVQPVSAADLDRGLDAPPVEPPPPAPDPAVEVAERTYTVKPGQTLSHISLEVYGTTKHWPAIAERNNVSPERLRPGMELFIPAIAPSTPTAANKPGTSPASASRGAGPAPGVTYTVRSGDTIQKISQAAYGTIERWSDIWLENFERVEDPRFLRAGMTLKLPN